MNGKYNSLSELVMTLDKLTILEMRVVAREFGIVPRNLRREQLVQKIISAYKGNLAPEVRIKAGRPTKKTLQIRQSVEQDVFTEENITDADVNNVDPNLPRYGILEISGDGSGVVHAKNYSATIGYDYYMSSNVIQRVGLRSGDKVKVVLHQYPDMDTPTAIFVLEINDTPCNDLHRVPFESLQPCFPKQRIILESEKEDYSLRALSLVAPIGKGQRGLIVAPPKTGKTILLKKIAMAVRKNHPDIYLTVLLIDERPEEVTDFMESVDCEVVHSTFDQSPQNHVRIAELVFNNARRRVEQGQHVMVLLDSITRLSRAYNQIFQQEQGKRLSPKELDIFALQEPKRMFGLGRNTKEGGSLTILATALVDTGSAMDDLIYEEFKCTGNMEIHLDRRLSEKRIFPAIDLNHSGTRREELLLNSNQLEGMHLTRRLLAGEDPISATENLLEVIMTTDNNDQTIETLKILVRNAQAKRKNNNT